MEMAYKKISYECNALIWFVTQIIWWCPGRSFSNDRCLVRSNEVLHLSFHVNSKCYFFVWGANGTGCFFCDYNCIFILHILFPKMPLSLKTWIWELLAKQPGKQWPVLLPWVISVMINFVMTDSTSKATEIVWFCKRKVLSIKKNEGKVTSSFWGVQLLYYTLTVETT